MATKEDDKITNQSDDGLSPFYFPEQDVVVRAIDYTSAVKKLESQLKTEAKRQSGEDK